MKTSLNRSLSRNPKSRAEPIREPNVTLRTSARPHFLCPACRKLRAVEHSKRGKPYLICNDCGVQVFFRGKEGIRRLGNFLGKAEASGNIREIPPLLEYTAALRNRLREIRNENVVLGEKQALDLEEQVVMSELARMEKVLEMELVEKRRQLQDFREKLPGATGEVSGDVEIRHKPSRE